MQLYLRRNIWWFGKQINGRRVQESTGTDKKRLAIRVMNKRIAEIQEAHYIKGLKESITFEKFVDNYYLKAAVAKLTRNSILRAQTATRTLKKYFGQMSLDNITIQDIDSFITQRKSVKSDLTHRHISNATMNREIYCMSAIFKKAVEYNYINENIVKRVTKFKEDNEDHHDYLSKPEIGQLLKASSGYLKAFMMVCIHCGLRHTEALSLKWTDIDFNLKQLFVAKSKNHKSRYLDMTDALCEHLKDYPRLLGCEYVFHDTKGRKFLRVTKTFNTTLKKAGLRHIRIHDLRHTYASHFVMAGGSLQALKENLGHKDMKMVLRYAHLADKFKKESTRQFQEYMRA